MNGDNDERTEHFERDGHSSPQPWFETAGHSVLSEQPCKRQTDGGQI